MPASPYPPLPKIKGARVRLLERWPGYAVSDTGVVFSCRTQRGGIGDAWRVHRLGNTGQGVPGANFTYAGRTKMVPVRQLVLEAFVGPRPAGEVACNVNGDANDNRLGNLRWCSRTEVMALMAKRGTIYRRFTPDQVRDIIREWNGTPASISDLAKKHGCTASSMRLIVSGRTYRDVVRAADILAKPERSAITKTPLSGWGLRFRKARRAAKMTGEQVAAICGVTKQAVNVWERRSTRPNRDNFKAFCLAVGIKPEDLDG